MIFKPKDKTEQPVQEENQQIDSKVTTGRIGILKNLNPKQQRIIRIFVIIVGVLLIAYLTTLSTPKKEVKKEPTPAEKKKFSLLTEKVDKELWISAEGENIEQMKKQIEGVEGKITTLEKSIEALREDIKKAKTNPAQQPFQVTQKDKVTTSKSNVPPIPPELNPFVKSQATNQPKGQAENMSPSQLAGGQTSPEELPPPVQIDKSRQKMGTRPGEKIEVKKIKIFENEAKEEKTSKKESKEKYKTVWIPAGTMIKAVLLTGMDAPTDVGASKEPLPVVMMVSDIAMMPNQFGLDLKKCIIIGSGWGNLADERAYIRTDTLSCITSTGKAFEIGLKGHVYSSEDGKSGLRGRYVSKQGQQIAMALLSGVLASTSQAFTNLQGNVVNVYTDDKTKKTSIGGALGAAGEQSLLGGAASAARSVADFYLKLADKMYPVIEIDAGRRVEIVTLKGQEVKIKI